MKWFYIIAAAVIAYFVYSNYDSSQFAGSLIPALVAPVTTGTAPTGNTSCTGKQDAQGHWYGVDFSGNCNIEGYGGSGGTW